MTSLSLQNFNSQFFVNRNCNSNSFTLVPKKSLRIAVKCSLSQTKTRCDLYDYSDKLIEYRDAWSWQKMVAESKIKDGEDALDSLMILQHPPVYTLGTRSSEKNVLFDMKSSQIEVHRTERGGEVTYHGPGQLVIYPIMNLRNHKMDLHWYLRALEDVVINVLSSTFGLTASRIDGLTGVWVGTKKVAAIGIRVSRWITYHGVSVNVTTDLTPFKSIVPCGIKDSGVSSIIELLKDLDINPNALFPNKSSGEAFALMDMTRKSLLKEFSDVFQVDFVEQELHDLKQIK